MKTAGRYAYEQVIDEICALDWQGLGCAEMMQAAAAYHVFSIQFRESLQVARRLYPADEKLRRLEQEECDTDNLSPWPGVADAAERMNHDEYMRRTLALAPQGQAPSERLGSAARSYLEMSRSLDLPTRAASIASYEDGGLERVFRAMLLFCDWNNPLLASFEHFLAEHIRFDSDPDQGHGALSRHITVDDRILPLWQGFKALLVTCVPGLARPCHSAMARIHELDGGFDVFPLGAGRLDTDARGHDAAAGLPAHDAAVCHP